MRLSLNSIVAWSERRLPCCSASMRTLPSNVQRLLAKFSPVACACSACTRVAPCDMTTSLNASVLVRPSTSVEAASRLIGCWAGGGAGGGAGAAAAPLASAAASSSLRQGRAMPGPILIHVAVLQTRDQPLPLQLSSPHQQRDPIARPHHLPSGGG